MTADADADADDLKISSASDEKENSSHDRKSMEIIQELREEAKKRRLDLKATKSEYELYKINTEEKIKKTEEEKIALNSRIEKLSAYETRLVNSELKAQAIISGIKDSDLIKLIDISDVKVGEDGEFDLELIKSKIETLKENKPFLFGEEKRFSTSSNMKVEKKNEKEPINVLNMNPSEWSEERRKFLSGRSGSVHQKA